MSYRGRFAPSPTGLLHAGSLVAAVGSWLCARHAGGQWLVRMEDIDPPREVPGSAAAILAALPAFGLVADEPVIHQSSRIAAYETAFEQLRRMGLVFPCWCSRSDLAAAGGIHRDGRCIARPDPQREPAWRIRVADETVSFIDERQGPQQQHLRESVGDFVIRRVEGFYSYQLACVVDDAWQGITQVVRGSDLLDSTPRQIWLQRCLGLPTPHYLHLPLVLDSEGHKLSKSERSREVDVSDPIPSLHRALTFLGITTTETAGHPSDLLDAALKHFDPRRLTQCSDHRAA
ncbi:tRNA glutamyl-Q(34) synthetase GluQRS [Dyella nitratireducens]|uniref:Glutamyl-Q tRNA(Asp) synthetase n=1 Tax=Dyella nitratireducens TaxID=1849580 RepID=A0ABQ1GKK8_9GAMM|nr:tRNA glutamyl-Q(34) synthetase GluQRS [Dyella nitratireducens]GGA45669.1 glutamyl-Q tRNA(Asp) synthetase [Dyella nitratireducens]GLQ41349.1 glutamyl-Q tRNA(Asp) synthetase [Dyella nitratireducens]